MAWSIRGRYFENCSCDVPLPGPASNHSAGGEEFCHAVLVFHVDTGEVDGVDVSDLTVVVVIDSPQVMTEGNWRLGLVVDSRASHEQATKLEAVFVGQRGGPMQSLIPLVSEVLGVETVGIVVDERNGNHRLTAGTAVAVEVRDQAADDVGGTDTGRSVRFGDIFHRDTELTAGEGRSRVGVFGLEWSQRGTSGFSAPFAWSG
jgi:hypothetical protein